MGNLNTRLQTIANGYTNKGLYAGVAWRVEKAGNIIANGTSGTSDEAAKVPLADDAIYRIYSMTKPVVSVMALILMQRGQLRLSDFVMHYIPAFASTQVLCDGGTEAPTRPVTIEDLLTHRSGVSYDFLPDCLVARKYAEIDLLNHTDKNLAEFVDLIASFPLASQPGSQWRYSLSTDVLARVLEVASGQPLDQLLEENIFTPLGMADTDFYVPGDKQARLLPLFGFKTINFSYPILPPHDLTLLDGEAFYPSRPGHNALRGGLGLFSTCADYSKFATMLLTGRAPDGAPLIAPAMYKMMLANRIPESQLPLTIGSIKFPGYGFCLIGRVMQDLGQAMSLTAVGEFGWEGAAGTYFWVDPQNQLVGVLMTQFLATYLPLRDDMRSAVYAMLEDM
ncbi:MAG: serine hydrolase [Gammaproteobacteria bacterium]|nr:MAG: serine hydrolase [Gammaproteobacteria bacterium]RLA62186.1 MAG: serine hydrolase [Gammaproteobacteria bacterium]